MDGNGNLSTILSMVDGMINGVVVFSFESAGFTWQWRRQRAGDDGGGVAAAATSKKW